jgi:hypothetical protein
MTSLLVKNSKIKNSNSDQEAVFNFGITAYQTPEGFKTCPMAGSCAKGCYATQGTYAWDNVSQAYYKRFKLTLTSDFVPTMHKAIQTKLKTAKRQGKQLIIRVHDSGDFYSLAYVQKWFRLMKLNPEVQFYAYTKMVPLFKKLALPSNFTLIFSEGGLADHKIDQTKDRHARVFDSLEALQAAGYDDTTKDDTMAFKSVSGKIGLVYHGAKAKKFTTV